MKTDKGKIWKEVVPCIILMIVFGALLAISEVFEWSLLAGVGIIGILIFGLELYEAWQPIHHYFKLRKALAGRTPKQITDWLVLDATTDEQKHFLMYLARESFGEIFRHWNMGVYQYKRISEEKYIKVLILFQAVRINKTGRLS